MSIIKTITLDISGPGIILYSPSFVSHIYEGEDYLSTNYMDADQVQPHIQAGTLVGFGTSSPGRFFIHILEGYPEEHTLDEADFTLRLGIQVRDSMICIRDLYDLLNWTSECPSEQILEIDNGYYHITLYSNIPSSGILGDDQIIWMYFNMLPDMPELYPHGVPTLC